ncbi:hypothetical protein RM844_28740 [Streptomyces sp. DSM 44915]|uniref:Capsid maturation protease n=1 Tax=Streptomyces chisholmiae TaxID=3075540 RepID=A0ABU2JZ37_9ACTN|nr:hypothetical protein [Streptomyces sp. DSM 44915]MDT0270265.1 hypothetical protein [Streptomyces sp. DSM 44915]
MSPTPTAVAHQRQQARASEAAARAAGRAWSRLDPDDIRGSWRVQLAVVIAAVSGGQLAVAQAAEPWLTRLLGDEAAPAEGNRLSARSLVGATVDGRPLAIPLMGPMLHVLGAIGRGATIAAAFSAGRALLDLTVRTLVADTGRAADTVGMITRPTVTSYIRVVEGGACDRCLILAGREYGISTGFLRHPRCQCGMEPRTREHRPAAQDPRAVFDRMTPQQQASRFGRDAADAIRHGADIAQVVNARRGMSAAGTTPEGTTRRGGWFRQEFQRLKDAGIVPATQTSRGYRLPTQRLTPAEIYRRATTREQAVALLRQYGYLTA